MADNQAETEASRTDLLRAAGCTCSVPLHGYRVGAGPRCRLCNTVALQPISRPAITGPEGGADTTQP